MGNRVRVFPRRASAARPKLGLAWLLFDELLIVNIIWWSFTFYVDVIDSSYSQWNALNCTVVYVWAGCQVWFVVMQDCGLCHNGWKSIQSNKGQRNETTKRHKGLRITMPLDYRPVVFPVAKAKSDRARRRIQQDAGANTWHQIYMSIEKKLRLLNVIIGIRAVIAVKMLSFVFMDWGRSSELAEISLVYILRA